MNAYAYVAKMRILANLAYRFEVFASIITNMVVLTASVFLWKTAYRGVGQVAQVNEHQMIVYTTVSILMSACLATGVQNTIHSRMREGDIAVDMMRPLQLLGVYFAEDIGNVVSSLANKALPLLIFASLVFFVPLPAGPAAFALFLLSLVLSYAILWLLSALTGLMSFWVIDLGNLGIVKDAIVRILSGSLLPIWFFPGWLARISAFLPFQYTYQTPLGLYIGRTSPSEALPVLLVQLVWAVLLLLLLMLLWRKARQKTMVQGG